ncbi:hypothetical protein Tco_0044488 [Tanacetum coccineum]
MLVHFVSVDQSCSQYLLSCLQQSFLDISIAPSDTVSLLSIAGLKSASSRCHPQDHFLVLHALIVTRTDDSSLTICPGFSMTLVNGPITKHVKDGWGMLGLNQPPPLSLIISVSETTALLLRRLTVFVDIEFLLLNTSSDAIDRTDVIYAFSSTHNYGTNSSEAKV